MKFLVTVGTTPFDSLIKVADELAQKYKDFDFISQTSNGEYEAEFHFCFKFKKDILNTYSDRIVITHCGAGTIYQLLELRVPFIAVPNLERVDIHQREMANFLDQEGLSIVCYSPEGLFDIFEEKQWENFLPKPYLKDPFFSTPEIMAIVDRFKT